MVFFHLTALGDENELWRTLKDSNTLSLFDDADVEQAHADTAKKHGGAVEVEAFMHVLYRGPMIPEVVVGRLYDILEADGVDPGERGRRARADRRARRPRPTRPRPLPTQLLYPPTHPPSSSRRAPRHDAPCVLHRARGAYVNRRGQRRPSLLDHIRTTILAHPAPHATHHALQESKLAEADNRNRASSGCEHTRTTDLRAMQYKVPARAARPRATPPPHPPANSLSTPSLPQHQRHELGPREKYAEPLTASQEVGWNNPRILHAPLAPKLSCPETLFQDALVKSGMV